MNTPHFRTLLEEELASRTERNPHYSLRSFAQALGVVPSALSEILSAKRLPSPKMAQKILSAMSLSPEQANQFFHSLATAHQERGAQRISPQFKSSRLRQKAPVQELSIELFRVIAEWYHAAILELTFVKGFKSNPRWIASQLGISPIETKLAIERLIKLGLLAKKGENLVKTKEYLTTADKHLTTPALKKMQKQSLQAAAYSLEQDSIEERSITTLTMAIDPERLKKAKLKISQFNREICRELETGTRKRVYNLTIALYPIQKKAHPKKEK